MADAPDLGSGDRTIVGVQVSYPAPSCLVQRYCSKDFRTLADHVRDSCSTQEAAAKHIFIKDNSFMEIERKWLVNSFPDHPCDLHAIIEQFYLTSGEIEVRARARKIVHAPQDVRLMLEPFLLTVKGPGTLSRVEVETQISALDYTELKSLVTTSPILKDFRVYRVDDYLIEFSLVDNSYMYAEVEFNDEDEADAFVIPQLLQDVVIREITHDDAFKLKNYWRRKVALSQHIPIDSVQ